MIEINFLDKKGNIKKIKANEGESLLEISKKNNLDIEGACGGEMICSTCHVYIVSNHINKLKKQSDEEKEILLLSNNIKKKFTVSVSNKSNRKIKWLDFFNCLK